MLTRAVASCVLVCVLFMSGVSSPAVPKKMNYQVMLTDASDEPLPGPHDLVFRVYSVENGGGALWTEAQSVTANSIGVACVVLGSVVPLNLSFDDDYWLEIEVDGEVMSPRREFVTAPYAFRAEDSNQLGGMDASEYATTAEAGDGHSLDAADGSPTDVVYVDADGNVGVGDLSSGSKMYVYGGAATAGFFKNTGEVTQPALSCWNPSASAARFNSKTPANFYTSTPVAVFAKGMQDASGGLFDTVDGFGVLGSTSGTGDGIWGRALGSGYSGFFEGGKGVSIERSGVGPVLWVSHTATSGFAMGLYVRIPPGTAYDSRGIWSSCYHGNSAHFDKWSADGNYSVKICNEWSSSPGLYVYGYIYSTSAFARGTETSRGEEAVFSVASPDVEIHTSGGGRLRGGRARVEFDRVFAESVSREVDVRVVVTPIGAWSGVYVERVDVTGFDVAAGVGDMNVEFSWTAVGRERGKERRPDVTIPDAEAERDFNRQKQAELEAAHRDRPAPPEVLPDGE